MSTTKFCEGISDISDSYMGFIIDQWGVLHDGEKTYDGVVECLKELKARKKTVIILSNSGKRAEQNRDRLKKIGIGPSLYDVIVTSGEMTWQGLHDQDEGFFTGLGKKCLLFSRGGDRSIVDGLDIDIVDTADIADFVLIAGSDAPEKTLEDYEPHLRKASQRRLKALCANPDSKGVMGANQIMGPGRIAERYHELGGVVHYIGKPHKPIFQHCINFLQKHDIYPGQTVMIGDTMAHDMIGAANVMMDTCLIECGLHKNVFKNSDSPAAKNKMLAQLVKQYNNVWPTYMAKTMDWGNPLPDRKHKKRATKG